MSHPFVIWTMQRTGGTTLASLLMAMSEHPSIEHEPLNRERRLGWISEAWTASQDEVALRDNLRRALEARPTLKHCFELVPEAVNRGLVEVATALGYRHLVLDRRSESDRILSLALARTTGVWGRKGSFAVYGEIEAGALALPPVDIAATLAHLRTCRQRRRQIHGLFQSRGVQPLVVLFEEVYDNPAAGARRVQEVADFLALSPATIPDYHTRVAQALSHSGQNSGRVTGRIPNIAELRAALEAETAADPFSWA